MIIGVTGLFAAGKDTLSAYLEEQGFRHISLSDILRDELRERELEITIAHLTAVGNELRQTHGHDVLSRRAAGKMEPGDNWVVSSIRHPAEVQAFREGTSGFVLVFVDAPVEKRFQRSQARGRLGDEVTFESFVEAERRQLAGGDPAAQQLLACREMADFVLVNDSTPSVFLQQIDDLLKQLHVGS